MSTALAAPASTAASRTPVYAWTIFLSAFLLFVIQPVLAKVILPWFGGGAGVWAVAILFFQGVLLLGYAYAYLSANYLPRSAQSMVHMLLLAASLALLPISPWQLWQSGRRGDPAMQILTLLLFSVGLQYFLLSSTGPLMQSWYARSLRAAFPYRLFALSNLGSLAGLVAYPFLVEPFSTTRQQLGAWSITYGVFVVFCCLSAVHFLRRGGPPLREDNTEGKPLAPVPRWRDYAFWTMLASCSSALLLAVTNHVCQNVAPIPVLWILTLAVYLLSFILCFDRSGWYRPAYIRWLLPPVLAFLLFRSVGPPVNLNPARIRPDVGLFLICLLVCCLFCHGELARRKPPSSHLTSFYLTIAFGGCIGSVAVGLVAPRTSTWQVEFPEAIITCGLLAASALMRAGRLRQGTQIVLFAALALFAFAAIRPKRDNLVLLARSFYGSLAVRDQQRIAYVLTHGEITHGLQIRQPEYRNLPTTYYSPLSGIGIVLRTRTSPWQVGVVGLGVGTLAAYGRPQDSFKFFEIDALVEHLATKTVFTFLKTSQAKVAVALGDGRLLLNREPSRQYDLLAIDAFSGDFIPTHLLTREAFEVYFRVLKPEGILAIHISNKFIDLKPVIAKAADVLGKPTAWVQTPEGSTFGAYLSDWVLLGSDNSVLRQLTRGKGGPLAPPPPGFRLWTDDYSNVLQLLR